MAKHGSVGKGNNRSDRKQKQKKKNKEEAQKTELVKIFFASPDTEAVTEAAKINSVRMSLEEEINRWIQLTGFIFKFTIAKITPVPYGESLMLVVQYFASKRPDTAERMRKVLREREKFGAEGAEDGKEEEESECKESGKEEKEEHE